MAKINSITNVQHQTSLFNYKKKMETTRMRWQQQERGSNYNNEVETTRKR